MIEMSESEQISMRSKQVLKELSLTKQILEQITEGTTNGILFLSKDLRILWANKAILEQVGYTKEEIFGKHCYKITHDRETPCEPPYNVCPVQEAINTGKPITTLHTHFDKNGNEIFVQVTAYPIKDEKGEIIEFVHMNREITEHKRVEEQTENQ